MNRQSENVKSQTRKRETLGNLRKGKCNVSAKIDEKRKRLRLTAIIVTFFSVRTVCLLFVYISGVHCIQGSL